MSQISNHESGFTHVAAVLVVLVFGAIGAIGYTLYANPANPGTGSNDVVRVDTKEEVAIPTAPEIKSAEDLDQALNALDQVDPDKTSKSDSSSLERQADKL